MTSAAPAARLDDVIITDELQRRACRAPDHAAESDALVALFDEMAHRPAGVQQRLVELVLRLCRAESAGISLLEPGGPHGVFRWVAVAGAFAPLRDATMPREASPCGVVIDRDALLLFSQPLRCFPHLLQPDAPTVEEGLLVPFHLHGRPMGTVWAVRHAPQGRFDAEDARLLQRLAGAASAACGMVLARDTAQANEQANAALAEKRRLYEAILTNTPDLCYVFDLQHRFVYANEGLLKVWGRTWDEAIGKNCLELGYEPWHAAMHDREIDQVVATRAPLRGEVPFAGRLGERVYDYLFVPVLGADGEVEAVAGTTRDITAHKRAQRALHEADRRKDEFLATLAHELRNPLAPIRTAVRLLQVAEPGGPQAHSARDIIERQVRHMVRLVDDLLDVSRITLGQIHLRRESVDLAVVLAEAVESARPAMAAAGHRLEVRLPTEPLRLPGDATRLSQVLQNLLDNAAKYTPPGGHVAVRAERHGNEVRISVRDNGLGIPPELQSRIFELFTRVHQGAGLKASGLGIGLALSRQLVDLHGGRIDVHSAGAGQGTEFTVCLPLPAPGETAPQPAGQTPAAAPVAIGGLRVLVVDDNQDAAASLAMLLDLQGCSVRVAFDGAGALQAVEAFHPGIVLLDIGLPGMDGYEVARRLRAGPHLQAARLVALTGWGQAQDKRLAEAAGFDDHLTKPVDPQVLTALLARAAAALRNA